MSDDYNFFTAIVAGEKPEDIINEYDKNKTVTPYVVYHYKDAHNLKNIYVDSCKDELNENGISDSEKDVINDEINYVNSLSDDEFFDYFTVEYDLDNEGNAVTDKNKKGKYSYHQIGKMFCVPFITLDGNEVFQARKKDIDWNRIHLFGQEIYRRAWEMVMEKSEPMTDQEKNIFENMKNRTAYFEKFKDKKRYVTYATAFWGYAFVDDNKWIDMDSEKDGYDWVSNFYERFIDPLDDNTLLTIYECRK